MGRKFSSLKLKIKIIKKMFKYVTQQFNRNVRRFRLHQINYSSKNVEVSQAISGWTKKLHDAGVGDIDFNLKCLVAHVLKKKFNALPDYKNAYFTDEQLKQFERLCEARCARMPLQYLLGEWDFMDLTLKTAPTVFIPRPETEEFVHKIIKEYRNVTGTLNALEIGCGSGAMSLALLHSLPNVKCTAVERSKIATALAEENALMLKLQDRFKVYNHTVEKDKLLPGDINEETYDLIISNPPYVKSEEFQYLSPEVIVYENIKALDGGPDGLVIARLVFDVASKNLRSGGKLWLELGADHPPLVMTLINQKYKDSLRYIASHKDQYMEERFVEIEKV